MFRGAATVTGAAVATAGRAGVAEMEMFLFPVEKHILHPLPTLPRFPRPRRRDRVGSVEATREGRCPLFFLVCEGFPSAVSPPFSSTSQPGQGTHCARHWWPGRRRSPWRQRRGGAPVRPNPSAGAADAPSLSSPPGPWADPLQHAPRPVLPAGPQPPGSGGGGCTQRSRAEAGPSRERPGAHSPVHAHTHIISYGSATSPSGVASSVASAVARRM